MHPDAGFRKLAHIENSLGADTHSDGLRDGPSLNLRGTIPHMTPTRNGSIPSHRSKIHAVHLGSSN